MAWKEAEVIWLYCLAKSCLSLCNQAMSAGVFIRKGVALGTIFQKEKGLLPGSR
jgi:formate/nitrite transporter FocA (FNT family)